MRYRDRPVRRHRRRRAQPLFPADSVDASLLEDSATRTVCPWKGTAHYKTLVVGGVRTVDAVWYYPDPKPEAAGIRGRYAFWKGVSVG